MNGARVTLSWSEVMFTAIVGCMRHVHALRQGRKHSAGAPEDLGWQMHIEGAAGEFALAKAFGLFWNGTIGIINADDVGRFQVRTSPHERDHLIVRPEDPEDRPFVFVTGRSPRFHLRGWIYAGEAKRTRFWTDKGNGRPPAYFIPCTALRPIGELLDTADAHVPMLPREVEG